MLWLTVDHESGHYSSTVSPTYPRNLSRKSHTGTMEQCLNNPCRAHFNPKSLPKPLNKNQASLLNKAKKICAHKNLASKPAIGSNASNNHFNPKSFPKALSKNQASLPNNDFWVLFAESSLKNQHPEPFPQAQKSLATVTTFLFSLVMTMPRWTLTILRVSLSGQRPQCFQV